MRIADVKTQVLAAKASEPFGWSFVSDGPIEHPSGRCSSRSGPDWELK
jgi:hypothetical protein